MSPLKQHYVGACILHLADTFVCDVCMMSLSYTHHTHIHTLMAVAAMQGADLHIRSSWGFSILPKATLTCRPGESNQRPSDKQDAGSTPEPQLLVSVIYHLMVP